MLNPHIDLLNRRLGEALGFVASGYKPRFMWKYAPDEFMHFYTTTSSIYRRRWADLYGPGGAPIGRSWLIAGWKAFTHQDHYGFGQGVRLAVPSNAGYSPYFELTAYPEGSLPSERLNARYIRDIRTQLAKSVENNPNSFEDYMMEEKYDLDRRNAQDRDSWRETAAADFDKHIGAFGNCEPGKRHGYLALPSTQKQILEGFGGI